MRHVEVAEALGTSPGNARQAVFEARIALQDDRAGRNASCQAIREEMVRRERRRASRTVRGHLRSCNACRAWSDAESAAPPGARPRTERRRVAGRHGRPLVMARWPAQRWHGDRRRHGEGRRVRRGSGDRAGRRRCAPARAAKPGPRRRNGGADVRRHDAGASDGPGRAGDVPLAADDTREGREGRARDACRGCPTATLAEGGEATRLRHAHAEPGHAGAERRGSEPRATDPPGDGARRRSCARGEGPRTEAPEEPREGARPAGRRPARHAVPEARACSSGRAAFALRRSIGSRAA